jgi:prepilin-type N-terminal cleavage/methylation domain-containing protein
MGSAQKGLTLLEMILSLTIVALIVALVSSGFNLAGTAIGGGERAAEQNQRLRLATDIMMRQIKSTALYWAHDEEEEYEWPYFQGTRHDLAFVTNAAQSGGGGLAIVTYRVQGDPPALVMAEATGVSAGVLAQPERLAELPSQEAVLLSGFSDLHFEYLVSDGIESEWFDAWDGKEEEELPTAVKVVIDGLAGLGGSLWAHQIPIMVAAFSETQAEAEDVLGEDDGDGDDDDDDLDDDGNDLGGMDEDEDE